MHIRRLLFLLFVTVTLPFFASAQWTTSFNGSNSKRAVLQFSAPTNSVLWGAVTDASYLEYTKEVIVSTNGGSSWTVHPITISGNYQVNAVSALDDTHVYAVLESDTSGGCIVYSGDGGVNWNKQDSAVFHSAPIWIHFWNDTAGLAVGNPYNGRFEIFTTTTSGLDWTQVSAMEIPVSQDGEFALTNSFFVKGDSVFFGGATNGKIFSSFDKGNTWTYMPFPLNDIKKVICFDSSAFIAGTPGLADLSWDLFMTYDGGMHWTAVKTDGPAYTADICHVPGTDSVLVSTGLGLSYSYNFGKTWTNFTGPATNPSPYYHTVLFSDLTHAWAGGVNPIAGAGGISKYNGPAMSVNNIQSNEFAVNLYPNPASDVLHIEVNEDNRQIMNYFVYDFSGRLVLNGSLNTFSTTTDINISGLTPGFYSIQLKGDKSTLQKELIVR